MIDESVADVGIGSMEELHKGSTSAGLGRDEVHADDELSESKKKLKRLKGSA
jgi:hypothetical protein